MSKRSSRMGRSGVSLIDILLTFLVLGLVLTVAFSHVQEVRDSIDSGSYYPYPLP